MPDVLRLDENAYEEDADWCLVYLLKENLHSRKPALQPSCSSRGTPPGVGTQTGSRRIPAKPSRPMNRISRVLVQHTKPP